MVMVLWRVLKSKLFIFGWFERWWLFIVRVIFLFGFWSFGFILIMLYCVILCFVMCCCYSIFLKLLRMYIICLVLFFRFFCFGFLLIWWEFLSRRLFILVRLFLLLMKGVFWMRRVSWSGMRKELGCLCGRRRFFINLIECMYIWFV